MPQLFVQVKQLGKRKPLLENQPLELPESVHTLRQLIEFIVRSRVEEFNNRPEAGNLAKYLTDFDIQTAAETGKVGFDAKNDDRTQNADDAVKNAQLAFADGLVRVFLDETELESLDAPTNFPENGVLTFLRFAMLSGRSW